LAKTFSIPNELGADAYSSLLPFFIKEITKDIISLEQAFFKDDVNSIKSLLHKMKGTSLTYGASEIATQIKNAQYFSQTEGYSEQQFLQIKEAVKATFLELESEFKF